MSFIVISVQGSEDCVTRFYVNKKQCVTARTNQLMHVDNIIYHKKHRHVNIGLFLLKGQCHEKVYFIFFSCSSFPQAPELSISLGLFLFSKNYPWFFSQLKVHHQCRWYLIPWYRWCAVTCECLHEFWKKIEMTIRLFSGVWGRWFMKKNQKQKSRNTVPLNGDVHFPILQMKLKGTVSRYFLLLVLFIIQFPPSPRVFH